MKFIAALALFFALSSGAQAGTTVFYMRIVCKIDWEQYCKGITVRRIRDLRECLAKHEKDLLPQCQDHYKEAK
jgi:hypothetical protein